MAIRFPQTLAAAKAMERNQWALGDALLKECGPPGKDSAHNGSSAKLQAAHAELKANGLEYELNTLRTCRDTAAAFPPASREAGVSFGVHRVCGSPAMLNAALKAWEKEHPGERMAQPAAEKLRNEIQRQREAAWKKKHSEAYETAQKKHESAQVGVTVAKAKRMSLPKGPARDEAEAEVRRAMREAERAAAQVEAHAPPPSRDPNHVPPPEKMPAMLFSMEMLSKAMKAVTLADEALKLADEKLASYRQGDDYHAISEDDFGAVVEQALKAADRWRSVAATFQKASGKKGIHLSAVGGA